MSGLCFVGRVQSRQIIDSEGVCCFLPVRSGPHGSLPPFDTEGALRGALLDLAADRPSVSPAEREGIGMRLEGFLPGG